MRRFCMAVPLSRIRPISAACHAYFIHAKLKDYALQKTLFSKIFWKKVFSEKQFQKEFFLQPMQLLLKLFQWSILWKTDIFPKGLFKCQIGLSTLRQLQNLCQYNENLAAKKCVFNWKTFPKTCVFQKQPVFTAVTLKLAQQSPLFVKRGFTTISVAAISHLC